MNRFAGRLEIKSIEPLEQITELKAQYFALLALVLEDRWHFGPVPMTKSRSDPKLK
jgi:hypothetical protein